MKVTLRCTQSGCISPNTSAQTIMNDLKFEKTKKDDKIVIITIIIIRRICTEQVMHHAVFEKPLTNAQPVPEHWSP